MRLSALSLSHGLGQASGALSKHLKGLAVTFTMVFRFRAELRGHARPLTGAFLASLGYTAMRIAEPWPLKVVLDNVLGGHRLNTPFPEANTWLAQRPFALLLVAAGAILTFALLRGVFYYYQNVWAATVGQAVVMRMRRKLFAHVQRLDLSFHAGSSTGDLLTRLTGDILLLRDLLVASLLSITSEVVVVIGFLAIMFLMEPLLAGIAVASLPLIFVLVALYSGRIKQQTRKQRRREGQLASRMHEVLNGIHVVQVFAREDTEDERLRELNKRSLRSGLKTTRLEAQMSRAIEMSIAFTTAATVVVGAQRVLQGAITPGDLVVFVSYMRSFHKPLRRMSSVTERASKAASCIERITDVLDTSTEVVDGTQDAPELTGAIRYAGVSFSYDRGDPVLVDIDLTIEPGETVALVGHSGAGKTTLVAMIPRLHDPDSGRVCLDGVDARTFRLQSLRSQISVVPQDGTLFHGSIQENIAYGRLDASQADIEAAARAAQIHEFIVGLPDGYDTTLGERGVTVSGGQRQRLAIARALVRDAPIVILDEPTVGLDAESEDLVMRAMHRLLEGRTALVIAHRLSTIRSADRIVVMESGRIVEQGNHRSLMAQGGRYRDLYALQFAAEERRLARPNLSRAG